jgi:hypothetical protein
LKLGGGRVDLSEWEENAPVTGTSVAAIFSDDTASDATWNFLDLLQRELTAERG